jgi:DNA polymerase-3 subunit gamma/tau
MTSSPLDSDTPQGARDPQGSYVVVARRYRPQTFEELVGQEHVAKALSNAISTGRVGHAYLFTGARGVGKTSAARIFAKALNCEQGPRPVPCNQCEICQSVSSGDDVDVLEIDGASNRGIDEIRQLRQNVNVRPSRARHKIYIIDEVHMLTREAFNALLKTLEEPPEHVKFIFCTTEASKIPITILSRCQRFDFAGILTPAIVDRLRQIVESEGVSADAEALETLARRAAGSMRDSQSLLEQLLSFAPQRITLADVHAVLGTTDDDCLARLVDHLAQRNAAAALADLDATLTDGTDVGQLLEQLLGYLRDCMAAAAGCSAESLMYCSAAGRPKVIALGQQLGLSTIMAAMQILDHTLGRLRWSTHGRLLAELALVRISQLEEMEELGELIARLESGRVEVSGSPVAARPPTPAPGDTAGKKNSEPPVVAPTPQAPRAASTPVVEAPVPDEPRVSLTAANAMELWNRVVSGVSGLAAEYAKEFDRVTLADPTHLVVSFRPGYALAKTFCQRPEQLARFEQALAELTGQRIRLEFTVQEETIEGGAVAAPVRQVSPQQRLREVYEHPMIRRAGELFGAQPLRVDDPTSEG